MIAQILWLLSLPVVMFLTYKLVSFVHDKLEKKQLL
jgi:hypothetical protein